VRDLQYLVSLWKMEFKRLVSIANGGLAPRLGMWDVVSVGYDKRPVLGSGTGRGTHHVVVALVASDSAGSGAHVPLPHGYCRACLANLICSQHICRHLEPLLSHFHSAWVVGPLAQLPISGWYGALFWLVLVFCAV